MFLFWRVHCWLREWKRHHQWTCAVPLLARIQLSWQATLCWTWSWTDAGRGDNLSSAERHQRHRATVLMSHTLAWGSYSEYTPDAWHVIYKKVKVMTSDREVMFYHCVFLFEKGVSTSPSVHQLYLEKGKHTSPFTWEVHLRIEQLFQNSSFLTNFFWCDSS